MGTVVGLPLTEVEFSVLPPHFINSEVCSQQLMQTVVSGFAGYPDGFRSCIPYFLASVVYHFEFLKRHLDPRHPLFKSRFITHGMVDQLKGQVVTGLSVCQHTNMAATGIPPHLAITSAMEKMRTEIIELNHSLKRSYEEMREFQSQARDELPQKVVARLLENVEVNGALPLTRQDFANEFAMLRAQLESQLTVRPSLSEQVSSQPNSRPQQEHPNWDLFLWGGKLHHTPTSDYKMPR